MNSKLEPHVKKRLIGLPIFLVCFQCAFIILMAIFAKYDPIKGKDEVPKYYAMFMDIHSMMFIGFGFLMTFLKRYGYSSVGFNFLVAAYVLEWAILVRGWLSSVDDGTGDGNFLISIPNLFVADFCAAAVLISFGAVIGKASLSQLVLMATIEVVLQSVNEYICLHYIKAYDVGESMYVHVFGAYFGLAVSKVLNHEEVESKKESANYTTDLFAMIGTVLLWLYWPSFNSATAVGEGQNRAIVNTFLSISASCIITFVVSILVSNGKLNMIHVQNATLAGGVAVGTVADMVIQPYGAMIIGSIAGMISTLGYKFLTPFLKNLYLHDTCGVNNLHGMPGIISGLCGAIVASMASRDLYGGDRLYTFYPARTPVFNSSEYFELKLNGTEYSKGDIGRTATMQGGFQVLGLLISLCMAIAGGIVTGLLMKLPIIEQVEEEHWFEDTSAWIIEIDEPHQIIVERNRGSTTNSSTSSSTNGSTSDLRTNHRQHHHFSKPAIVEVATINF